jgi:hypothetical protein
MPSCRITIWLVVVFAGKLFGHCFHDAAGHWSPSSTPDSVIQLFLRKMRRRGKRKKALRKTLTFELTLDERDTVMISLSMMMSLSLTEARGELSPMALRAMRAIRKFEVIL